MPATTTLQAAAADVAAQHGLALVVLFGSAARGGKTPPGDIDIAVKTIAAGPPLADALAIVNTLIQRLHIQPIDLVDLRRGDPLLLMQVAQDGIALYEETPTTFAEFVSLAARRYADTAKFRRAEQEYIDNFVRSRKVPK